MYRSPTWLCLVVVLLVPRLAAAQGFGDLEVARAVEALERGDEERALYLLNAALVEERQGELWSEARFIGATTALRIGRPDLALAWSKNLADELPEIVDYIIDLRAQAHRAMGRWDQALVEWRRVVSGHVDSPRRPDALYSIADGLWAQGELSEARAAYVVAMKVAPRSQRASQSRFTIAHIDELQRRYSDAASTYRYIAFHRPHDTLADEAMRRFDALVATGRTRPASFRTRLSRADRLLSRHLLDKSHAALDALEPDATTPSRQTSMRFRRAQLAYRDRDFDAAVIGFRALRDASSGSRRVEYTQWLARCFSASNQNDEAIELYNELADAERGHSNGKEALFKAAWLAYNARQHARAVKLFAQFVERYPSDSATDEALWYLAWNAYRLGDLPTAVATLERLHVDFPDSSLVQRTHYWQGRIREIAGDAERAFAFYNEVVADEPLSYYGTLAQQRLAEAGLPVPRTAHTGEPLLLASLAEVPAVEEALAVEDGAEPASDELPEAGGLRRASDVRLPWGGAVLDWDNADGARALRLIKVLRADAAAQIVRKLPALPGHDAEAVAYTRARLLYALRDYNGSYRIGATIFRDALRGWPRDEARHVFHLAYPRAHGKLVDKAANEFDVSPLLLLSVMRQESAFRSTARSPASAQGLMQIIPPTGRRIAAALGEDSFAVAFLHDPRVNVRFGGWYLGQLLTKFHGSLPLAIASYNAGPKAVERWVNVAGGTPVDVFVEEIPYRETRKYVKRVLGNLAVYGTLYGADLPSVGDTLPTDYRDNIDF